MCPAGDLTAMASGVGSVMREAVPIFVDVAKGVGKVAVAVGDIAAGLADAAGGWENFGTAIGAIAFLPLAFRVGVLAWQVGRLGAAIVALAAPVLALSGPVGWVALAVTAAVGVIIWQWERVGPVIGRVVDRLKADFDAFLANMRALGDSVGAVVGAIVEDFEGETRKREWQWQ